MFVTPTSLVEENICYENPLKLTVRDQSWGLITKDMPSYHLINLKYKYGEENMDDLVLEGCCMKSNNGVTKITHPHTGKVSYRIQGMFNNKEFEKAVKAICHSSGDMLLKHRNQLKVSNTCFRNYENSPIKKRTGSDTDKRVPGSKKWCNFTLIEGDPDRQSLFTDLDDNQIPWELLTGVHLDFVPIIRFKQKGLQPFCSRNYTSQACIIA